MRSICFAMVAVCFLFAISSFAQTINEARSIAVAANGAIEASFSVDSRSAAEVPTEFSLLDTNDKVVSRSAHNVKLVRGRNDLPVRLSLPGMSRFAAADIVHYRIRYRVGSSFGMISLSKMLQGLFELRVINADKIVPGKMMRMRILTSNPLTGEPVAGVKISATISFDIENKEDIKSDGVLSNGAGEAEISLKVPEETEALSGSIHVSGEKLGLFTTVNADVRILVSQPTFLTLTDKTLYQPGQAINLRGILMSGSTKTVISGEDLEFRILDFDDTLLFRGKGTTSEYGIAATEWRIPENAKLGRYTIEVLNSLRAQIASETVTVSRYEVPNFIVEAAAEKKYYLPADISAAVKVKANYLFGQPVTRGKVRVVREKDRSWDSEKQKYVVEEGDVREGEIDGIGEFSANFDLTAVQQELASDGSDKYRDIHFTAYVTDLSTNRTEERRFDGRITLEPIHVYIKMRPGGYNDLDPRLPVVGYFTTFYADGTPAACNVEVLAGESDADKFKQIARSSSNSFGIGRFEFRRPKIGDEDDDLDLKVVVRDARGAIGSSIKPVSFDTDDDFLAVSTPRSIYAPGENVELDVHSFFRKGTAFVEVLKDDAVLETYALEIKDHKARFTVPFSAEMKGAVKMGVYMPDPEHLPSVAIGSVSVIYPSPAELKVNAEFGKDLYKPGEDANARFSVLDAAGRAVESVLGIVVVDRAVEERADADGDGNVVRNYASALGFGIGFGNVNIKNINDLPPGKLNDPAMQLAAEAMLADNSYEPTISKSPSIRSATSVFESYFIAQFSPVRSALKQVFKDQGFRMAENEKQLAEILAPYGIDPLTLRDPWGTPYRIEFGSDGADHTISFISAGTDKIFDRSDGSVAVIKSPYFAAMGNRIQRAMSEYTIREGAYIRDEKTLLHELGVSGLNDRYGRPYQIIFDVDGRYYTIRVRSLGKDGKPNSPSWIGDDFDVWYGRTDFFRDTADEIARVLTAFDPKPGNQEQFVKMLLSADMRVENFRDGFGRPLYLRFTESSRYYDRYDLVTVAEPGEEWPVKKKVLVPVTQKIATFALISNGKDGVVGSNDDQTLAEYRILLSEQSKDDAHPVPKLQKIKYAANGTLNGTVTDVSGTVIQGVVVVAKEINTEIEYTASSDENGRYRLINLLPGIYSVTFTAPGFNNSVFSAISVASGQNVRLDAGLEIGNISESVEIRGNSGFLVEGSSSQLATNITIQQIESLPATVSNRHLSLLSLSPGFAEAQKTATPRLREYFPETLLWQPELVTDADGKAALDFKMADNITTWRMYTIASTKDGRIGLASKDITAFQSFFADLDPPKFLTVGDEISLPVQIRNYTQSSQQVEVKMSSADWFQLLSSDPARTINVASGGTENAVFDFRAVKPVDKGKQRVSAVAAEESDAIEKPVTVRPDGQEHVRAATHFGSNISLIAEFPANMIADTAFAEVKIYPNMMAHVIESVEGLLRRPYGCAEQTISSTYPNLMILKYAKSGKISPVIERSARKNLLEGIERLTGYQTPSGGFGYWSGEEGDIALTAYAIRFLNDAASVVETNPEIAENAERWLLSRSDARGAWTIKYSWEKTEDIRRTYLNTAYILRSLSMNQQLSAQTAAALKRTNDFLAANRLEVDEPYTMALVGLAALDRGDPSTAADMASKLADLVKRENGGAFWMLESNTPFYGWGTAGRIETTALVMQLFQRMPKNARFSGLISEATIFLLKNKDQFGVWHSTQTTINVLDAFLGGVSQTPDTVKTITISLNGIPQKILTVKPDQIEQISVPLTALGERNNITVSSSDSSPLMAAVVSRHYEPWDRPAATSVNLSGSAALRLSYACDKLRPSIMETVTCTVDAERIGFRGYGMLLAEIGLPPGADVSRESLKDALAANTGLSSYEIHPDRIVAYISARPGGTKFSFKFNPRYGINAKTPASVAYDYYNPEAQAVVKPLQFVIK